MAATSTSAAIVSVEPVFTGPERLALAGFLAAYRGLTRQAYELDLRQFADWCQQHLLCLFSARRADIECFARDLEARGRAALGGRRTARQVMDVPEAKRARVAECVNDGQRPGWQCCPLKG